MRWLALSAVALSLAACTQSEPPEPSVTPPDAVRIDNGHRHKWPNPDTDHDGKLSQAEKDAALETMLKIDGFRRRTDRDGDGKISPEERERAMRRIQRRWDRRHREASGTPEVPSTATPEDTSAASPES